jgi:SLT domain-containing protein
MQTIPSTYRAYVHPDLAGRSITDPVANITAGVRYMIANYGLATLEAGGRKSSAGHYIGY